MPLAPQPRRRTDAPRAAPPWGTSLLVLSAHLSQPCQRKRFLGTPRWRTLRLRSGPVATPCEHLRALRPSQSTVDVCNEVCNGVRV